MAVEGRALGELPAKLGLYDLYRPFAGVATLGKQSVRNLELTGVVRL